MEIHVGARLYLDENSSSSLACLLGFVIGLLDLNQDEGEMQFQVVTGRVA